jgi:hypothetical protein
MEHNMVVITEAAMPAFLKYIDENFDEDPVFRLALTGHG